MNTKHKIYLVVSAFFVGIWAILEGLQITNLGEIPNNTPNWVLFIFGVVFCCASVGVILGDVGKWNDLIASILTALMGIIFGWVTLFGDSAGFSGNIAMVSTVTEISIDRFMFAIGTIFIFSVSIYTFKSFVLKVVKTNKKYS